MIANMQETLFCRACVFQYNLAKLQQFGTVRIVPINSLRDMYGVPASVQVWQCEHLCSNVTMFTCIPLI